MIRLCVYMPSCILCIKLEEFSSRLSINTTNVCMYEIGSKNDDRPHNSSFSCRTDSLLAFGCSRCNRLGYTTGGNQCNGSNLRSQLYIYVAAQLIDTNVCQEPPVEVVARFPSKIWLNAYMFFADCIVFAILDKCDFV